MSEYKPGTVAVATVRGVKDVRVMRDTEGDWATAQPVDYEWTFRSGDVTDIRPLVVLDLDDYAAKELASWLDGTDAHMSIGDRLRVAREIRHQTKPSRIPEPGLWGVVREGVDGDTYVRESFGTVRQWSRLGGHGLLATWDEIKNPTLIREGVSA